METDKKLQQFLSQDLSEDVDIVKSVFFRNGSYHTSSAARITINQKHYKSFVAPKIIIIERAGPRKPNTILRDVRNIASDIEIETGKRVFVIDRTSEFKRCQRIKRKI